MDDERFGPYVLLSLLGRGGMGEVYRAVDTRKSRGHVALKRLPAGLAEDSDFQRRFLREAEVTARLRNPHVVPIHDYGQIDGRPYLEMRLIDGTDLSAHLREGGALAPGVAADVITQVAAALDAAHGEGLVHRDVKPQNMVRSADGFVHLIDFGIAANLMSTRNSSSVVAGTVAYMAPERFVAGGDNRVDVYALGCVLYELLTGHVPFAGDHMQQMWSHANAPPPLPSAAVSGLPSVFDDVVAIAMAKRADDRYPTAGALAAALSDVGHTTAGGHQAVQQSRGPAATRSDRPWARPTIAPPDPRPRIAGRRWSPAPMPGRRRGLALAGAVLVLVAAVTFAAMWPSRPPEVSSIPTLEPTRVATSPDGHHLYALSTKFAQVSVIDVDHGSVVADIDTGSRSVDLSTAAGGSRVYIADAGQNIVQIVDSATHATVGAVQVDGPITSVAPTPDGRTVVAATARGDGRGTVSFVDSASGAVTSSSATSGTPRDIAVSPDGRSAYVTFGWANGDYVATFDVAEGRQTGVVAVPNGAQGVTVSPDGQRAYVASSTTGVLSTIDVAGPSIAHELSVSGSPRAVTVSPDGNTVYVGSPDGNLVSIVDRAGTSVSGQASVIDPEELAVAPDGRHLYAASTKGGAISSIDLDP